MKLINYCNLVIEYSFYSLFLLIPLVFWGSTSELFELNKIWLNYGLTIVIVSTWLIKIILAKKININKTPLDLPLMLFFISQAISTVFSLDSYVSFFGYYSRFNGGLLSTISYLLLYFAFTSNFNPQKISKLLKVIIISAVAVVLWGLPSHFGYDPTCYVFRGQFDVSCWTDAFKPTIRIFSTLGQPAWLAAFLAAILPLSMSKLLIKLLKPNINSIKKQTQNESFELNRNLLLPAFFYVFLTAIFYLALIYTGTRAGFIGFWVANTIFWIFILLKKYFTQKAILIVFLILNGLFLSMNFLTGTPIEQLNKFTLNSLTSIRNPAINNETNKNQAIAQSGDNSITDSADIRRIVWKGAIDAWKANPIFGTGVETFAFAYYQHRPTEHNLTSEWDYLYNKAHNEYINYLTTTGIVGLGTYLLIISVFIFTTCKLLLKDSAFNIFRVFSDDNKFAITDTKSDILIIGLFTGWLSILITNFFGFSVVIINLFFFLIPAITYVLTNQTMNQKVNNHLSASYKQRESHQQNNRDINAFQYLAVFSLICVSCYLLLILFQHWQADKSYSLGTNLSRANYPKEALDSLSNAVSIRPSEPVFQDELSLTALQLSLVLFQQNEATSASEIAQTAVDINTNLLNKHPNYLTFWKSRIRLFYALGELQSEYKEKAIEASKIAAQLAPTDAKIWYNLGVLYGQTGELQEGINTLNKTIEMKPDYYDAYYALGLLYRQMALDDKGNVKDTQIQQKATEILEKLLDLNPKYIQAKKTLEEW